MRRVGLTLAAALLFPGIADAQEPQRPSPRVHRYDEDWRAWCAGTDPARLDRIKCLEPAPGIYVAVGGELRERFENARNPGFGLRQDSESAVLHRVMAQADVRAGEHLRGFVQFGWFEQSDRDRGPAPTDVDRLDLTQGFVDLSAPLGAGQATLRAGRQELSFGSQRLIAVREGPNIRRSYDGVRAFWSGRGARADVFYVQPVGIRRGTFDDGTTTGEALWGVYATAPLSSGAGLSADLYYLGFRKDGAAFTTARATERRHTFGARLFGSASGFDWDIEAAVQTGEHGSRSIGAWTLATDMGHTFSAAPLSPRLGFKADIASGDGSASDDRLGTFNALYPKLPYFSEASLVTPSNIIDIHPSLRLELSPTVTAQFGWNALWRHRIDDAIYAAPLLAVAGTAGRPGRFIGHQAIIGVAWKPRPGLTIAGDYVHFQPGEALRRAGAGSVDVLVVSAAYRF